jgi:hypothetical protein
MRSIRIQLVSKFTDAILLSYLRESSTEILLTHICVIYKVFILILHFHACLDIADALFYNTRIIANYYNHQQHFLVPGVLKTY